MNRSAGLRLLTCATALCQSGCSTSSTVSERTVMLREVAQVLTRQEILASAGSSRPAATPRLYNILLEEGWQQVDMVDGSVVLGRTQFHWTAASPDAVRQYLCWSPVVKGLAVSVGNVVEVEQRGRLATVVQIKYRDLAEGGCAYRTGAGEVVGTPPGDIRPVGDEGAASLHCTGLAEEGWVAARLRHGIEWRKLPPTGQPNGPSPRSESLLFLSCQYGPLP